MGSFERYSIRAGAGSASGKTLNQDREVQMPVIPLRVGAVSAVLALLVAPSGGALAQKKYDVGASDTEIKIGNIMP